jgi:hypothetical protein
MDSPAYERMQAVRKYPYGTIYNKFLSHAYGYIINQRETILDPF